MESKIEHKEDKSFNCYGGYANKKIYTSDDLKKFMEVSEQLMAYEHSGISWKHIEGAPIHTKDNEKSETAVGSKKLDNWQYLRMEGTDKYGESAELQEKIDSILSGIMPERELLTEGEKTRKEEKPAGTYGSRPTSESYFGLAKDGKHTKSLEDIINERGYGKKPEIEEPLAGKPKDRFVRGPIANRIVTSGVDLDILPDEVDFVYDAARGVRINGMDGLLKGLANYYAAANWDTFKNMSLENFETGIKSSELLAQYLKENYSAIMPSTTKKAKQPGVDMRELPADDLHPERKSAGKPESEKRLESRGKIMSSVKAPRGWVDATDRNAYAEFQKLIKQPRDQEYCDLLRHYLLLQHV